MTTHPLPRRQLDESDESDLVPDPAQPCGRDSMCMVVFGGQVVHDETWHRPKELEAAVADVLRWREGDLPNLGYLRDNDRSRASLARLAQLVEGV